jgi:hypothetical protein
MAEFGLPSLWDIERANAILAIALVSLLAFIARPLASGCALGASIMIANLMIIAGLGKVLLAAGRKSGLLAKLAVAAAPFKLVILAACVFWLLAYTRVNPAGFCLGLLTQLAAVLIETGRGLVRAGIFSGNAQGG